MSFEERYELQVPLGESERGTVWNAKDQKLGRSVAVAVLEDDVSPSERERFVAAIEVARPLRHAALVRIFDSGVTGEGAPFASMELVEGVSLQARLTDGPPLRLDQAVRMMIDVLGALSVIHGTGVAHGDVEPGNILVKEAGGRIVAKLIGIGLNRASIRSGEHELDEPGHLVGVAFMSPRQASKEPADAASDVYSAAGILYTLMTGCLPHYGADVEALREDVGTHEVWAVARLRPELVGPLADVVDTALGADVSARFETADALSKALRTALLKMRNVGSFETKVGAPSLERGEEPPEAPPSPTVGVPRPGGVSRPGGIAKPGLSKALAPKAPLKGPASTGAARAKAPAPPAKPASGKTEAKPAAAVPSVSFPDAEAPSEDEGLEFERLSGLLEIPFDGSAPKRLGPKGAPPPPPKRAPKETPEEEAAADDGAEDVDVDADDGAEAPAAAGAPEDATSGETASEAAAGDEASSGEAAGEGPSSEEPASASSEEPSGEEPASASSEEASSEEASSEEASSEEASSEEASSEEASSEEAAAESDVADEGASEEPGEAESSAVTSQPLAAEPERSEPAVAAAPAVATAAPDTFLDEDADVVPTSKVPAWVWGVAAVAVLGVGAWVATSMLGDDAPEPAITTANPAGNEATEVDAPASDEATSLEGHPGEDAVESDGVETAEAEGALDEEGEDVEGTLEGEDAEGEDAEDAEGEGAEDAEEPLVVTLTGVPDGATIWMDGERASGSELELSPGGGSRSLEVRLDGHRTWRHTVAGTESVELAVELEALPHETRPREHASRRSSRSGSARRRGSARSGRSSRASSRGRRSGGRPSAVTDPGF